MTPELRGPDSGPLFFCALFHIGKVCNTIRTALIEWLLARKDTR